MTKLTYGDAEKEIDELEDRIDELEATLINCHSAYHGDSTDTCPFCLNTGWVKKATVLDMLNKKGNKK